MATPTPCAIRSITLQAGESYVLPPGAEIISATDVTLIQSNNDCANLDNVEDLNCYIFVLIGGKNEGSDSNPWQTDAETRVNSLTVGQIIYSNVTAGMGDAGNYFTDQLASIISADQNLNGILLDPTSAWAVDTETSPDNTRGAVATLCFKTVPSLAAEMYLTIQTRLAATPSPTFAFAKVYPILYTDYTGVGKCSCTIEPIALP
jgi:hypothetical protein